MKERPKSRLFQIAGDVVLGERAKHNPFVNLYGCSIGADTMLGAFVELQRDVTIGARCRIQSHSSMCSGVTLEEDVFIGHGVIFINDRHPSTAGARSGGWGLESTKVGQAASIGSAALIMGGVTIGAVVAGVPARLPSR